MEDLADYLELILNDSLVEVVRIKNRFDSSCNREDFSGYRGVYVHVCVCDCVCAQVCVPV